MSRGPRVSTIIIFLNEERFLSEAVESVLAQTYPSWELLFVDDGSTDNSSAIARDFAHRHSDRLRYLTHPGHENRGMSASRNLGLARARGDYVGFLDADDLWLPGKLANQVDILDKLPHVDMVYGRTLIWHSWAGELQATRDDFLYDLGVTPDTVVQPPDALIRLIENRAQTPTTCNALMRKRAMQQVGAFENIFRGMFEDQVFFMKMCASHDVFAASPVWAWYRQRDDSCTAIAERSGELRAARIHLLEWLEGYLDHRGVDDPRIRQALRAEMWACKWPTVRRLTRAVTSSGYRVYTKGRRAARAVRKVIAVPHRRT